MAAKMSVHADNEHGYYLARASVPDTTGHEIVAGADRRQARGNA